MSATKLSLSVALLLSPVAVALASFQDSVSRVAQASLGGVAWTSIFSAKAPLSFLPLPSTPMM